MAQGSVLLFDRSLRGYLQDDLENEAQALLIALINSEAGIRLDEQRLDPNFQRPFSGHYFRIDVAERTLRSRSLWDRDLPLLPSVGLNNVLGDGPQGQRLLVYRADFKRFGRNISVQVAQDYTPILRGFRQMQWLGGGLGIAALLLLLLAQRYTVRTALRPLERVRAQIAQLQQGRRGALDAQVPEELEPLVRQINHLLSHTEDTLKRSRHALGNLGHALKTPLAVLLSLSSRAELQALPELQATLRDQLRQIQQRLERELGKARLAGDVLPGAHFVCERELPALFATLQMIHGHELKLKWQAEPGLYLPWDREDLLELLGNLLDNACKWADSQVLLGLVREGGRYRLWVDDDGPGIAPERRESVLGRGTRLDEQMAGHGLGLGIVRDMVEIWDGCLSLDRSPLGGLRVIVDLPERQSADRYM